MLLPENDGESEDVPSSELAADPKEFSLLLILGTIL
jgi:hypothetical protein